MHVMVHKCAGILLPELVHRQALKPAGVHAVQVLLDTQLTVGFSGLLA